MDYQFASPVSVYQQLPPDEKAVVLSLDGLPADGDGRIDITCRLQETLDELKGRENCGILFVPAGEYLIRKTVYLPRAVRLIGYGKTRPVFILPENTPGYQEKENYLIWFTSNVPSRDGMVQDANAGTFYSTLSNIDFRIEDGNPSAVAVRAHFAQHCFVSHCRFDIGTAQAGISQVGNEMENLIFTGGEYGIQTTKCSPGWPFVLVNSAFYGQRQAAVHSRECGLTFSRVQFSKVPAACDVEEGYWEKIYWKDCILEDISGAAIRISQSGNSCTQVNLQNLQLCHVSTLLFEKDTGKEVPVPSGSTLLRSYTHGRVLSSDQVQPRLISEADFAEEPFAARTEFPLPPSVGCWHSVKDYGAVGDGMADDTAALQKALEENDVVYLPQGFYRLSDTVSLRPGNILLGLNPITTQLILAENTPAFAGFGPPKPVLCSSKGYNMVSGIAIDAASRNPRAVGCKWMAAEDSYMNDVKFVGGHGQIRKGEENVLVYNAGRTGDVHPDRPWHSQYWSLWITEGGGTFKDIWSADTYAAAGIFISETETPGRMYQISVEHHVRHEILMRRVRNWSFYGIQTEEEVAEGSWCQPYELSECANLLFANMYLFRVIWVDTPLPSAVQVWDCRNLTFMNVHNYTQMKYTAEQVILDMNSGRTIGFWQLARLDFIGTMKKAVALPAERLNEYGDGEHTMAPELLVQGLDCVDALCSDHKGHIYLCDSRIGKIYCWDEQKKVMTLVSALHFRPLSLACDTEGRLMVAAEYKPVKGAMTDGKPDLKPLSFGQMPAEVAASGSSFVMFYGMDRTLRVYVIDPAHPESSMEVLQPRPLMEKLPETLYFPLNQWRDFGDIIQSVEYPLENIYLSPDGKTAIASTLALTRAACLSPMTAGKPFYLVDEYGKRIIRADVDAHYQMHSPQVFSDLGGEYGFAMKETGEGCLADHYLYILKEGEVQEAFALPYRPACPLFEGDTLYLTARKAFYQFCQTSKAEEENT